MVNSVSFNPMLTSNALGSFSVQSDGLVQGTAFDDPAVRFALAGGYLAASETLPMWGGVGIYENVAPFGGFDVSLGGQIGRATSIASTKALTGFSVFNQAHAWITTPQSQVPLASSGMTIPFYRLGSGARIAVGIDPSLVSLEGGLITQQVSWDFNNQVLQPYDASTPTYAVTSITSSFAAGVYTMVVVMGAAPPVAGVGDVINISGVTGTGAALVNGNQTVTAFTDASHFTFQIVSPTGTIATGALGGTIILNYGTGALNVKILQIQIGNSKTVSYSAATGYANWNPSGSAAVILI